MQRKDSDDLLFQPLAAHEAYKEAQGAERPVQIHAHPDGQQAAVEGQHTQVQKPTRKAHMDTMLTVMVKRASPAARRMLGMVKLEGQMNSETMLNHTITSSAMA